MVINLDRQTTSGSRKNSPDILSKSEVLGGAFIKRGLQDDILSIGDATTTPSSRLLFVKSFPDNNCRNEVAGFPLVQRARIPPRLSKLPLQ